ncbi:MAG: RNA methyltransferase [Bacteroidota bacterium]|nr:RNA methyltransferase [Bacteroidota bacterium]
MLSKKVAKYIQSLSHKKLRDELGAFVAEGPKVVSELLSHGIFSCKLICANAKWLREAKSLTGIPAADIYEIEEEALKKISLLKAPNAVVAVFQKKELINVPAPGNKITLLLDDISDPGNLGTIIRIADWFGIENIICSENCVDCYNPKVVQSTMGSLGRVNIFYQELSLFISANKNINSYAAALSGKPLSTFKNLQEGFILIGNESKGVSEKLLEISTAQITIPKFGEAESLNAAVAAGIILSHIKSPLSPEGGT